MSKNNLPPPTITLIKRQARRFMLAHHHLWPPRRLVGKVGVMDFVRRVGCIQFDPINVVGRNPDLVLQARVGDYQPALLEELLYADRQLLDGWDKMAAIYSTADWPYFARHRVHMRRRHDDRTAQSMEIAPGVITAIQQRGPLSSIDVEHDGKVDWFWGVDVRLARAALETLYAMGELVIHHRVGSRRVFDLAERVLPPDLLSAPEPNPTPAAYQDWHVLRRVGGLGLANPRSTECWLGILGTKTEVRGSALARLAERGEVVALAVEGVPGYTFFARACDMPGLEVLDGDDSPEPEAALIAPLDNLIWDRQAVRLVFDFDYVWEVYKPVTQRKYGYYVLPVLYGDRFVARLEPAFDKKERELTLANWWWETGVLPDEHMEGALVTCFRDFARYLDAGQVRLGTSLAQEKTLRWVKAI
jgi:uncharacterized protein YcaQ